MNDFIEKAKAKAREVSTGGLKRYVHEEGYTLQQFKDEIDTATEQIIADHEAYLLGKVEKMRQNENPMEDGYPVETYGYEYTHNQALAEVTTLLRGDKK